MSTTVGRNNTQVVPGEIVTLYIILRSYYGGPLTDADSTPTFIIYDPNSVAIYTGTATHTATGTYSASYTVDDNATYSDYYKIEWTAAIGAVTVPDAWEYFRVVPATSSYTGISITQDWLNQVKKEVAYPKLETLVLTDDQIKEFAVFPALTQYFIKFPIKTTIEQYNTDLATIPFPDLYTFGLLDCRVVDMGTIGGTGSSFWDILAYQRMGVLGNTNVYGRRGLNPNGLYQQRLQLMQAMKSQQNLLVTIKFIVDYPNRQVQVYTSTTGKVNITWAKFSNDFEDVIYQRKFDVIQLAQANLLDHVASVFDKITDGTLDVNINVENLRNRATKLREEILDKWMAFPAVVLLHSV